MNLPRTPKFAVILAAAGLLFTAPAIVRAEAFPPLNDPSTSLQVPGKFIWADLFTDNPEAASNFYSGLFGWTAAPVEQKNRSYIILTNGDHPVAGIVQRSDTSEKRDGVWIGYISVPKAKDALKLVEQAGGEIHATAHKFPHRGIQAIVTDSEGSPVGLLQSSSGDPADREPARGDWNWFELYSLKAHAASAFYRQAFGYEVKPDDISDKRGHLILSAGGHARAGIAPLRASPDAKSGWLGCIRVDNIDETVARAVTLGGAVAQQPRPAALGSRFAVITDPTGGSVGVVQYIDNANPATAHETH